MFIVGGNPMYERSILSLDTFGLAILNLCLSTLVCSCHQPLYHLKSAHSIFVTGLAFTPDTPTALGVTGGYDFSLLSISADNHVRLHQTQPTGRSRSLLMVCDISSFVKEG